VAAGALHWFVPFLTAKRDVTASTPSIGALFDRNEVNVPAGATACVAPVRFDSHTQVARLRVLARRRPAPRLVIVARAPGYRSAAPVGRHATGGDQPVTAPPTPPPGPLEGRLCVVDRGRRPVRFVGTSEIRSRVAAGTSVDGKGLDGDVELTLLERR